MPNAEVARDLLAHSAWADAEVWAAIRALPSAYHDAKLREKLHHIHVVQQAFLAIWELREVDVPALETFVTIDSMATWARRGHESIASRAVALSEAELESEASIPWSRFLRERFGEDLSPVSVFETMIQVASHSTYHRGQVNTRLRELGGEPPLVDFIAWVWFHRPAPRWELRPD